VQPYGAYGGDLNNDGYSDLTIPCEQTDDARVFINNLGTYSGFTAESLPNGSVPSPIDGGDFDNDGEIDVVIANIGGASGSDKISILFGDGTGDFPDTLKTSYAAASAAQHSIRGVGVVDLNGDGWDDIVAADRYGNKLSIFLNHGDGTFAPAVAKEAGSSNEWSIAFGDANNDGLLDVYCGNRNSPYYIVVLLSDGNGGLTAQPPVSCGNYCWQLVTGDFDGDGNMDVAGCASSASKVALLHGDGAAGFTGPVQLTTTGSFPLAIDAGDVDGDGDLEILTSNYDAGTWTLFENRFGSFVNPRTLNASASGSEAFLHDRDNDGDMDITGIDEIDDWIYFFENEPPVTSVRPAPEPMAELGQNRPNPFNPSTTIRFEVAGRTRVDLSVYDPSGALVTKLADGLYDRGVYDVRWNGADARGVGVSSGVYFYRLVAGGATLTRKMVLLK
jgi:hypothetical protein